MITKREKDKLTELIELLKEMQEIISSNYYPEMSYPLGNIQRIIEYLTISLQDEAMDFKLIMDEVRKSYEAMFIAKTGISEFGIWNEDDSIMYKENQRYDKIKKKIRKVLEK